MTQDPASDPSTTNAFEGDLFKEIGHTLEAISTEVISGSASALKTAIARQALNTPEGTMLQGARVGQGVMIMIAVVVVLFLVGVVRFK
jgi:hypothetical protein